MTSSSPKRNSLKWLTLSILAGLCTWFCVRSAPLRTDSSIAGMATASKDVRAQLLDFERAFGSDDLLLVALIDESTEPALRPDVLATLRRMTESLERRRGVARVVSLTNLSDFDVLFGSLPTPPRPLVGAALSPRAMAEVRAHPIVRNGLLSKDARTLMCWVALKSEVRERQDELKALDEILDLPDPGEGFRYRATGFPLIRARVTASKIVDVVRIAVVALVLIGIFGLLVGIHPKALAAWGLSWPLIAAASYGILRATGRPLHFFSADLFPLLIITSSATLVHLTDPTRSARDCLIGCALSVATTAMGFLVLTQSRIPSLNAFGLEAAAATLVAFAITAPCLAFVGANAASSRPLKRRLRRALPWSLVVLLVLLALPWWLLAPNRLASDGDLFAQLPPNDPVAEDTRALGEKLEGLMTLEVLVVFDEATATERLRDPETLRILGELGRALEEDEDLGFVLGPSSLLAFLNTKITADPTAFLPTMESARFAARWLLSPYLSTSRTKDEERSALVAALDDQLRLLVTKDGTRVRFTVRLRKAAIASVQRIRERLERTTLPAFRTALSAKDIVCTGYAVALADLDQELQRSERRFLALSAAVMALMLLLAFRDAARVLPGLLVNAATVLGMVTVLWAFGAELGLHSTLLIATLAGFLADNTIHLLLAVGPRPSLFAVGRGTSAVRRAILRSSLMLCAGFSAWITSPVPSLRTFGISALAAVILATLWDLWMLPRLILRCSGRSARRSARLPGTVGNAHGSQDSGSTTSVDSKGSAPKG